MTEHNAEVNAGFIVAFASSRKNYVHDFLATRRPLEEIDSLLNVLPGFKRGLP